ncbi:MAG: hypothetical protein ACTHKB_04565, partial [Burkholderiaceae bacterium]
METESGTDEVASALRQLGFLKGSFRLILAWPVACLLLGALVWVLTLQRLETERQNVAQQA